MLKKFIYTFWVLILFTLILWGIISGNFSSFIQSVENRTFDIRQNISVNSEYKKPNKDIVIIAIDDASYEYIMDKYGEWPLRRDVYADVINYIETQQPKIMAFDLLFVKSMKSAKGADEKLIDTFKKYDNIYTAMNLDYQEEDLREKTQIPEKLTYDIKNNSKLIDMDYYEFTNCRTILDGILNATSNIGMINVLRGDDGVLRSMPLFLRYEDKYYPQLGFKVALGALGLQNERNFVIDKKGYLKAGNKKIFLNSDGSVILNWYGSAETYTNIPLYKILKTIEEKGNYQYDFKDKIVYFGATASSLFDIKTVPVDKVYPGVEVQTTYVNNILDGNLIRKTSETTNILFAIGLAVLTLAIVLLIDSMPVAFGLSVTVYFAYIIFTYYIMLYKNLWVEIVSPLGIALLTFIITVIAKYLIKSRDFDKQYKLATTDGLTDLYNHRYFQEQMQMFCANSKRYNSTFSLIILDIDFFKKFNDNFGHQSGDAVLRQVAQTLKKNVRATDIVCRYGGEEMSIILPNASEEEALNTAQKLCKIVSEQKFKLSGNRESNVTISLGVSTYGKDGTEPAVLIEIADKHLYNAKNNGRNRVN